MRMYVPEVNPREPQSVDDIVAMVVADPARWGGEKVALVFEIIRLRGLLDGVVWTNEQRQCAPGVWRVRDDNGAVIPGGLEKE